MFATHEGAPLDAPCIAQRQMPLALRFDCRPFWPTIQSVLGGTETLTAVALALTHADGFLHYSRAARQYPALLRYRNPIWSWRLVTGAMDRLDALGLIKHERREPGRRGWQSAACATPELRNIIKGLTPHSPRLAKPKEVIVLRDSESRLTDYRDTRETDRMRMKIQEINEGIDAAELPPTIRAPVLRIFNRSMARGGRLYAVGGGWQVLPKEARARISIDGEPVVELDFKCLHPALLYAEVGAQMPVDAYDLAPWPRTLAKLALLVMANAKSKPAAIEAIQHHEKIAAVARPGTQEAKTAAHRLCECVELAHAPITRYFGADAGARLMKIDSAIAEAVILEMLTLGIVVLPVHDSFICPASKANALEQVMIETAERITGTRLTVT